MKTITFFSEKGGVGKSSFSIMYTSWLSKHGVDVGLVDFNNRITNYRAEEVKNREKLIRANPGSDIAPFDEAAAWPIHTVSAREIMDYRKNGVAQPYYQCLYDQIHFKDMKDKEVLVLDYPGSLTGQEFPQCFMGRLISYIAMPTERDQMTLDSTWKIHSFLKKQADKDPFYRDTYCVFMNKAQLGLNNMRSIYMKLMKRLVDSGLPMLPDMVTFTERMASIDKVDIFRSTFGYPDFDSPEYEKVSDIGLGNLFTDITRELARRPNVAGTATTDIRFAGSLAKKDDGRQFRGSAFPKYEI